MEGCMTGKYQEMGVTPPIPHLCVILVRLLYGYVHRRTALKTEAQKFLINKFQPTPSSKTSFFSTLYIAHSNNKEFDFPQDMLHIRNYII